MTPIVVIDDDPTFLHLMHDILSDEGYCILVHPGAAGARTAIAQTMPRLAIVDLHLEQPAAGLHLLTTLREDPATAHLPVLLCTADILALQAHAAWLREQGIPTLVKPFDVAELLASVRALAGSPSDR